MSNQISNILNVRDIFTHKYIIMFIIAIFLYFYAIITIDSRHTVTTNASNVYELPTLFPMVDFHHIDAIYENIPNSKYDDVMRAVSRCVPFEPMNTYSLRDSYISNKYDISLSGGTGERRVWIQEQELRLKLAETTGKLLLNIENMKYNYRMLQLFRSLEKRSQDRVKRGLTGVDEQVGYLKQVYEYEHLFLQSKNDYDVARISILSFCSMDMVDTVGGLL